MIRTQQRTTDPAAAATYAVRLHYHRPLFLPRCALHVYLHAWRVEFVPEGILFTWCIFFLIVRYQYFLRAVYTATTLYLVRDFSPFLGPERGRL